MFSLMAGEVIIQGMVLAGLLYLLARHEADYSVRKSAMVVGGIVLGQVAIAALLQSLPTWITLIAQIAFGAFMIVTFCWIGWAKSLVVVLLFGAVQTGLQFAVVALQEHLFGGTPDQIAENLPQVNKAEDIEEIKAFMEETAARQAAAYTPADAPPSQGAPPESSEPRAPRARPSGSESTPTPTPPQLPTFEVPEEGPVTLPMWRRARSQFKVSGQVQLKDGSYACMIKGKLYPVGALVSETHDGYRFRWRVESVTRDTAQLVRVDAIKEP